jgi:hypothetical protein
MKRKNYTNIKALLLLLPLAFVTLIAFADDYRIWTNNEGVINQAGSAIDSIKVEGDVINFYQADAIKYTNALENLDSITISTRLSTAFPIGIPHAPGIVEAEDFDFGGEGVAFHEVDDETCPLGYRTGVDLAVDLQANGAGDYVIGSTEAGEWLKYTINAPEEGTYHFDFWTGAADPGSFEFLIDGQSTMISYGPTGWGQGKIENGTDVFLTPGNHVVTIHFPTKGPNFGKFEFKILLPPPPSTPYPDGIPHAPGIVEAEHFDLGGEGVGYHDNTPENGGDTDFRTDEGVDIYNIVNPGNGNYFIGWNGGGEWLKYTINAPEAATYQFAFHVGTAAEVYIDLLIDEQPPIRVNFYSTGWGWTKIDGPEVVLSAGNHAVIVRFTDGGMNYDKFEFNKKEIIF